MSSESKDALYNILEFSSSDSSSSEPSVILNHSTASGCNESLESPAVASNIAFTPGRTTLQKESMLMLQQKFGNTSKSSVIRDENVENEPVQQQKVEVCNGFDSQVSSALDRISAIKTPFKTSIPVATPKLLKGLRATDSGRNTQHIGHSHTSNCGNNPAQSSPANEIDPSPTAASKCKRMQTPGRGDAGAVPGILKMSRIPVSSRKQKKGRKEAGSSDQAGPDAAVVSFATKQEVIMVHTSLPTTTPAKSPKPGTRVSHAGITPFKNNDFQIFKDDDDEEDTVDVVRKSSSGNSSTGLSEPTSSVKSPSVSQMRKVSAAPEMQLQQMEERDREKEEQERLVESDSARAYQRLVTAPAPPLSPTTELNLFLAQLASNSTAPPSTSSSTTPLTPLKEDRSSNATGLKRVPASSPPADMEALLTGQQLQRTTAESLPPSPSSPDSDIERLTLSSNSIRKESPTTSPSTASAFARVASGINSSEHAGWVPGEAYTRLRQKEQQPHGGDRSGVTPINFDCNSPPPTHSKGIVPSSSVSSIGERDSGNSSQGGGGGGGVGVVTALRRSDRSPAPQPSPSSPPRSVQQHQQHMSPHRSAVASSKSRIGSPGMQKGPGNANSLGTRRTFTGQDGRAGPAPCDMEGVCVANNTIEKDNDGFIRSYANEQRNFNYEVYGVYDFEQEEEEEKRTDKQLLHSSPHRSGLGPDMLGVLEHVTDTMPTGEQYRFEGVSLQCPGLRRRAFCTHAGQVTYPVEAVPFLMSSSSNGGVSAVTQQQETGPSHAEGPVQDKRCATSGSESDICGRMSTTTNTTTNAVNNSCDRSVVYGAEEEGSDNDGSPLPCPSVSIDMALSDLLSTPRVCPPSKKEGRDKDRHIAPTRKLDDKKKKAAAALPQSLEALRIPCTGLEREHSMDMDIDMSNGSDNSLLDRVPSDSDSICDSTGYSKGNSYTSRDQSFIVGEELNASIVEDSRQDREEEADEEEQKRGIMERRVMPAYREEYSDISLDCSAITFDPPAPPGPPALLSAKEKKRRKSKRHNKIKESQFVHLSKTKHAQSSAACASADIKEVTMQGYVHKATSASLTFENKKHSPMQLSAVVILVRVDELELERGDEDSGRRRIRAKGGKGAEVSSSSPLKSEKESAFALDPCSPSSQLIASGKEMKLRITFRPTRVALYSGVIKIKCGQKSYVVLLRGEALEPRRQLDQNHSPPRSLTTTPHNTPPPSSNLQETLTSPTFQGYYAKEVSHCGHSEGEEEGEGGGSDSSVYLQQKWVKHWIDKELHRTVSSSRSEVRRFLSPAGQQFKQSQLYMSRYEESTSIMTVSPSPPRTLPRRVDLSAGRTWPEEEAEEVGGKREGEALAVFPTTLFVDKDSGEAVVEGGSAGECGGVTIQNHSNRERSVHVEASASVLMLGGAHGRAADLRLLPYSSTRIELQIRPEFLSAVTRDTQQGTHQDRGEIHWGYLVVSCSSTMQESVCDIRSAPTSTSFLPQHLLSHQNLRETKSREKVVAAHQASAVQELKTESTIAPSPRAGAGVYFAKGSIDFGAVGVGSLKRLKATVCNATNEEMVLFINDPALPFIVSHNEVRMQPRSYIKLPIRMVPIASNQQYRSELMAASACGKHTLSITLCGHTMMR